MSDASVITCTACCLRIVGTTERHNHYRSDLHRVNLKRKVTGLGPLSEAEFVERVTKMAELSSENEKKKERKSWYCTICSKKFSSEKAFRNHLKSRRHLDRVKALRMEKGSEASWADSEPSWAGTSVTDVEEEEAVLQEMNDEMIDMELERRFREGGAFSETDCPFDGTSHESVEDNLNYMSKNFGFKLPYIEQLTNVEGLLRYMGQKVGIGYACVACGRVFGSVDAVQKHMVDKGHCMLSGDDWEDEYGEFYSFGEQVWDNTHSLDGDYDEDDGDEQEVEMVVGNKIVGHRSLRRYYKQSAGREVDSRAAVVANRMMSEYRAIGWQSKKLDIQVKKGQRNMIRGKQRFELMVGNQNYYTRKATFKQKMAVFNSGYRA